MPSTRLVPVLLPNGTVVKMETSGSGERDIAASEGLPEPLSFQVLQGAIQGVAQLVDQALDKIRPQKIAVEFGIELSYEAGKLTSLIVQGATKGSLKIALEWNPTTPPAPKS